MMKTVFCIIILFVIISVCRHPVSGKNGDVLFDDIHLQSVGNADWTVEGAYSDAADLLRRNGYNVFSVSQLQTDRSSITCEMLKRFDVFIIPEPNLVYEKKEIQAVLKYVDQGGGLMMIADHGGSDRNFDGYDSCLILNEIAGHAGFVFNGDTHSAAPVKGCRVPGHPLLRHVERVGAWGAASISIICRDGSVRPAMGFSIEEENAFYLISASYGQGNITAIGDSSPFDDGTGKPYKNLHDSFNSMLFDHGQLFYNMVAVAQGAQRPVEIPGKSLLDAQQAAPDFRGKNVLVDAAHGNSDADKLTSWQNDLRQNDWKVFYRMKQPLNRQLLDNFSVLVVTCPGQFVYPSEVKSVESWVLDGGNLLMAGSRDSNKLCCRDALNSFLIALETPFLFNSDSVWDDHSNTGKPWGVIIKNLKGTHDEEGIHRIISWGGCSLMSRTREKLLRKHEHLILEFGNEETYNIEGDRNQDAVIYDCGSSLPLAAIVDKGKGRVLAVGATHFSDYQYPGSDVYPHVYEKIDHQTPQWNLKLFEILTDRKMKRTVREKEIE